MLKRLLAMVLLIGCALGACCQSAPTWRKTDVCLDPALPGVYIEFVRVEESGGTQWVWLRLHNNMRWDIRYLTNAGVDLRKHGIDAESVAYQSTVKDSDSASDFLLNKELGPGESVPFRVRLDRITYRGWSISINFQYGWEQEMIREARHTVSFSFFDLPKELRAALCNKWADQCPA